MEPVGKDRSNVAIVSHAEYESYETDANIAAAFIALFQSHYSSTVIHCYSVSRVV